MARCTAPINGHRTASGAENCPACRGGGRYSPSYRSYPSYSPSYSNAGSRSSIGRSSGGTNPRWSKVGSSISYTSSEIISLTPVREKIEKLAVKEPDLRDVFLCHAWGDRKAAAEDLHNFLVNAGVKVWFSEKDIGLGVSMMRSIDKGLSNSRIGIVLVTPALLERLPKESVADKELSALLARNQLIPIIHNTSYEALREVSPLLASRSGLDTSEDSMEIVAKKIAELVHL